MCVGTLLLLFVEFGAVAVYCSTQSVGVSGSSVSFGGGLMPCGIIGV